MNTVEKRRNGRRRVTEQEREMPETLKKHLEMFRERQEQIKRWGGSLSYKDVLHKVNSPRTYRRDQSN